MSTLFILIGLPGSGKSTWAAMQKDCIVLSSDAYREKLFGDVADQAHNAEVFNTLRKDVVKYLKADKSIVYDATNVSRKDRRAVLQDISSLSGVHKVAVVFATPIDICKERNRNRERVVPDFVYDRMLKRFEFPLTEEGFNEIRVEYNDKNWINIDPNTLMYEMHNMGQDNPHHTKTVGKHCEDTYAMIRELTYYGKDEEHVSAYLAALFHDVGKLWTKEFDESGVAHFIGHENYGAYMSLFIDWDRLVVNNLPYDRVDITTLINYHMVPFALKKATDQTIKTYHKLFSRYWIWLNCIHYCDEAMSDNPFVTRVVGLVDMQELISEEFSVG